MRKILAILLALALLLSVTACADNSVSDSNTPSSSVVTTESSASTSAATQTSLKATTSRSRKPSSSTVTTTTAASTQKKTWYTKGDVVITKAEVDAIMGQTFVKPKNVIVMIADGMGPNDITIAEKYSDERFGFGLLLNQFKNHGEATTRSANSDVTDSAASATALATGTKTHNGMVGMLPDKTPLKNISEIAREQGKKVGIVTNDKVTGATPSGFTVHAITRDATGTLARGYVDFAPDVLIGQGYSAFVKDLNDQSRNKLQNNFAMATEFNMMPIALNNDPTGKKPFIGFYAKNLHDGANNLLA